MEHVLAIDMRCVTVHSPILATCSPMLASTMSEAYNGGPHVIMLPDTPFVEVMALVAVLYGHHGTTATPSEDLLSMLACKLTSKI